MFVIRKRGHNMAKKSFKEALQKDTTVEDSTKAFISAAQPEKAKRTYKTKQTEKRTERISLALTPTLYCKVIKAAKNYKNLNDYISKVLEREVSHE